MYIEIPKFGSRVVCGNAIRTTILILSIWLSLSSYLSTVTSSTCGFDNSPAWHVHEGNANIETYPWLGVLYYPYKNRRFTTAVVLVTRQMVIAAALEFENLPQNNFRDRVRVLLGHNCTSESGVPIRAYTYHPDYSKNTLSAIVLIQLEIDHVTITLRPICAPPKLFEFQKDIFAMVLSKDCNRSKMKIYKMVIVSAEECRNFYRRTELNIESMWPIHTTCARSVTGSDCIWRSGAILTIKQENRWKLLGFGVHGPGCQAPARFLDYGMYQEWVRRNVQRIGRPAITRIAQNLVVLRRSLSKVQRFGPCSMDEMVKELYTDTTEVVRKPDEPRALAPAVYHFNLTIVGDVEYSCVVLRADCNTKITSGVDHTPILRLRRFCSGVKQSGECFTGVGFIKIDFYVEIEFIVGLVYSVKAYGRQVRAIDPTKAHKYANTYSNTYPQLTDYPYSKKMFWDRKGDPEYPLYGKATIVEEKRFITGNNGTLL